MQLKRWTGAALMAGGLCLGGVAPCEAQDALDEPAITTMLRTFTDSDHVARALTHQ